MQFVEAWIEFSFGNQQLAFNHVVRECDDRFSRVVTHGGFLWNVLDELKEDRLLLSCVPSVVLGGKSNRACAMMKCTSKRHVVRIIVRLGEEIVPLSEAYHYFHRYRAETLDQSCVFFHKLGRQIFYHLAHITH